MGILAGMEGRAEDKEWENGSHSSILWTFILRTTIYTAGSPHSQASRLQMLKFLNLHNPGNLIL